MITSIDSVLNKSFSALPAHNAVMCRSNNSTFIKLDILYHRYTRNCFVNSDMALLLELQMYFGLRVSEALGLKPGDYKGDGMFTVVTLKGNENRIINIRHNVKILNKKYMYMLPLYNRYTRYYVYRLYKKLGIYKKYNNNVYRSVTHYFRHNIVKFMLSQGVERKDITKYMGWRSEKSILYYE